MLAIVKYILRQYKHCADRRNIAWMLTDDQAVYLLSGECVYCGAVKTCKATRKQYAVSTFEYNGIDRVDSDKPYAIDNCVSCCKSCNAAKSNMSVADFLNSVWLKMRRAEIKGE